MTLHFRPTYRPTPAGARAERAIVPWPVGAKGQRDAKPGEDLRVTVDRVERSVEVKCPGDGFRQLYEWLRNRNILIVKADRQKPLVVLRLSLAVEVAKATALRADL
jgi:hypothetical protein